MAAAGTLSPTDSLPAAGMLYRLGVKATTLKAKAKDLASKAKAKAKAKDGVKANVNMVRCLVKTSKHRRLLQGW